MPVIEPNFSKGPEAERRELIILACGFLALAIIFKLITKSQGLPLIFGAAALAALFGWLAFSRIGRDVYLVFALVASLIGRVVSRVAIVFMYGIVIAAFGSVLRLFGMNRLQRNFQSCRKRQSMFVDAPRTDPESFRRQS